MSEKTTARHHRRLGYTILYSSVILFLCTKMCLHYIVPTLCTTHGGRAPLLVTTCASHHACSCLLQTNERRARRQHGSTASTRPDYCCVQIGVGASELQLGCHLRALAPSQLQEQQHHTMQHKSTSVE